jgi:hypothetical protein
MFLRDIFDNPNPVSDGGLITRQLTTRDIVPARAYTLSDVTGTLVNRAGDFELAGRHAWIFISIKNRKFNRPYVDWFIRMCDENGLNGHICRVDDPYKFNRMAELGVDILPEGEAEKIERLSNDIGRMVQKALNGSRTENVDMILWRDVARDTPSKYHDEIRAAFKKDGLVRKALSNHVRSVKDIETQEQLNRFVEFFLNEVPILFHAYYQSGGTLDIYPGSQPDFFWQVEMGVFEDELPLLTALTRQGRTMTYFDTITKPGA